MAIAIRATSDTGFRLDNVDPALYSIAAGRDGSYALDGFAYDRYGRQHSVTANLTGKEWAALDKVASHGKDTESKRAVVNGNVRMKAASLFPDGSHEHAAMRALSPLLVTTHTYAECLSTEDDSFWSRVLMMCCGCCAPRRQATKLRLLHDADVAEADTSQDAPDRPVDTMGLVPPDLDCEESARLDHETGGVDALDKELRVAREGRILVRDDMVAIVGSSVDKKAPVVIAGVLLYPCATEPNVYLRTMGNALLAVDKRIVSMQLPSHYTPEELGIMKEMNKVLYSGALSTERIHAWAASHPFPDLRSKKWSDERFQREYEEALRDPEPRYRLEILVKMENTKENKAPRPLIDDKAAGQIYSLAATSCYEYCMFHWFRSENIKHRPREEALEDVTIKFAQLGKDPEHPGDLIGGDGSSFDATCSPETRGPWENEHLTHVSDALRKIEYVPSQFLSAHLRQNRAEVIRAKVKRGKRDVDQDTLGKSIQVAFRAIRRSGHRATSCCNWSVNKCIWALALAGRHAPELMKPDQVVVYDRWGRCRRMRFVFEGDDSLVGVSPPLDASQDQELVDIFTRFGFRMKLEHFNRAGSRRAEFIGSFFECTPSGLTGRFCPDVGRAFRGGASVSSEAKECFARGDLPGLKAVAASGAIAKAQGFVRQIPTLARKYVEYARSLDSNLDVTLTREDQMKMCGRESGTTMREVIDDIEQKMDASTPLVNNDFLEAVRLTVTDAEETTFLARNWHYGELRDWVGFREALPASWRP